MQRTTLYFYTFVAALGGLLFGFDTAVISGTIPFITEYFKLDDVMLGWAVSSALIGCIFGAIAVGKPADVYGRKNTLIAMALFYFVSALGTGLATNLTFFIFARFIGGIAVGGASVLSPMYISEIAPPRMRGRLVATAQLAIVLGILLAFFSNYLLVDTGINNWRWMFWAECIPALAFGVFLFFVSRSPRWLVKMDHIEAARAVIQAVNPGEDVDKIITEIIESIDKEAFAKSVVLFKKPYLRLILIGVAVGMFNQFTGINIIMYYAPAIFRTAGFSNDSALIQTVLIGATNLVFTILAMTVIDKLGRKFLLLMGAGGMSIFLGLFAAAYSKGAFQGYTLLIFLLGFIAFFAASQGVVIWVILSEMFPNNIRARATSIGSFSHWFFNALTSFLFPVAAARFGIGSVFVFYTSATVFSLFFFIKYLTETKGRSLEELEKIVLKG
ncbi:sugar porter family MFS transporter [candidate division KSB1 bacterium]|nr:sugar porter family MFS transporter [candidate division KSB1 bacterium]